MEIQEKFELVNDKPLVPPKLSSKITSCIEKIEKIDIVRCAKGGRSKINTISFPKSSKNDEIDIMEVGETICSCIESDCHQEGVVNYYEAVFSRTEMQPTRIRFKPHVTLETDFSGEDREYEDKNPVISAIESMQEVSLRGNNELLAANQQMMEANARLTDQLLSMVKINAGVVETQQKIISDLTEKSHEAFQLKDEALQVINSVKVAELEARIDSSRLGQLIDAAKPLVPVVFSTLMASAKAKGFDVPMPMMPQNDEPEEKKDDGEEIVDETSQEFKQKKWEQNMREVLASHPVSARIGLFKNRLDADTLLTLVDRLTKPHRKIFQKALAQTEEAPAVEAVKKLAEIIQDPKAAAVFSEVLDDAQMQAVMEIYQYATFSAAKVATAKVSK